MTRYLAARSSWWLHWIASSERRAAAGAHRRRCAATGNEQPSARESWMDGLAARHGEPVLDPSPAAPRCVRRRFRSALLRRLAGSWRHRDLGGGLAALLQELRHLPGDRARWLYRGRVALPAARARHRARATEHTRPCLGDALLVRFRLGL